MKEIKRLYVMEQVVNKKLTIKQAAEVLELSSRQTKRIAAKYREQGAPGIVHGNRGNKPNNMIDQAIRDKILKLAKSEYRDYNDCHFTEELIEKHGMNISRASVRRIRRQANLKSPRKRRPPRHRSRRERKEQAGMLLQTDGSRHDWLEGRGPWLSLIAYIDDATNEVSGAVFREEEDATGYFLGLQQICLETGIPGAIYTDQHTIFQSPSKATIDQSLAGEQPRSQFGRLCNELNIKLIVARSPQAKGRIERLWGTLQDRLVKALREAGASNLIEANQVLVSFLPNHNQRFRVSPAQEGTAYQPWPTGYRAKDYFCFKHTRTVTNDNTIPFDGHRLQIPTGPRHRSYAKAKVQVRQHLDGQLEVCYQGHSLVTFQPADDTPVRVNKFIPLPADVADNQHSIQNTVKNPEAPKPFIPAADHPWRKPFLPTRKENFK